MDENQQESTQASKSNLNPLLVVVILIIVAAVGVMLWLGSNKTATKAAMTKSTVTPTEAMMMQKEAPTGSTGSASPSATGDTVTNGAITVEAGSFYFKPNIIKVKKGEKVTITINNRGGFHDFYIDEFNVKSKTIPGGESTTVEFTPDKTGSFEFYCSIGNHRAMGMKGTLIVE